MWKNSIKLMSLFLLAGLVFLTACDKDDEEETPPVVILDGIYISGGGTALSGLDTKGMMAMTRNEVLQEDRSSLYEIYIAVKGGTEGFSITKVAGSVQTVYGPGADFAMVPEAELDAEEPNAGLWRGEIVESGDKFTVTEDALYHIMFDTELMKGAIAKVEWGVIGAATPGGWSGSTALPSGGFDLSAITFEATDVVLTKADWKFRYSNGWKVILDTALPVSADAKGVKVNSNFGGAIDALVPGGDNMSNENPGYYTISMSWSLAGGTVASAEKTGDLELVDYTDTELGLVGDGLMVGGVQHNWDETVMLSTPEVDETNYTWTYAGVEVTTAGSFKIREGQDWDGKVIGFTEVTMAGSASDKFEANGDGNFVPLEDGVFDMVLLIDAVTESYTFTVNPGGVEVLYMLGDGTTAGWDANAPITVEGTDGVYSITTEFPGGGGIKFISTIGEWQPQYGTDATGTWEGGPLLVNDGTGSDPEPIPGPAAAGNYTITVNTNDMTYTMVAAK